ncbi:ABC transporter substrate-binding protein [Roseovarius sp. M141]|uniref:ABC transporter substrate-binding protein n=1 Tax=Roseovarius sp. M141 TaxID=2583806 RepID=UPI0020CF81DA|nr:ABC transporter substrate-binding protein [Roseovarius sp. M141]MCQ0090703.1 ABC transporter substrate-binding protein [Roseovarius sp. M141]
MKKVFLNFFTGFMLLAPLVSHAQDSTDTLVVAAVKTPNGIDHDYNFAHEDHQIRHAIYERLFALGRAANEHGLSLPDYSLDMIEGRLAESWSLEDGGRTLVVKLREGVMSHAGNELTAHDVQWTWDRQWALDAVGAFYAKFILGIAEPSWEVVDRYTWKISTPTANPLLELLFVNNDLDIFDSEEAKRHSTENDPWAREWLATNGAGHGAFLLTEFTPGERVVLDRFDGYYRDAAKIDRIVYREVPEASNRFALVLSGDVHVADRLPPFLVDRALNSQRLKVWATAGNSLFRLDVNNEVEPTDNPLVRRALNHATPKADILEGVFFGSAEPSYGPVPSTYPGAIQLDVYEYDPDRARRLIVEAGAVGAELTINFSASDDVQRNTAIILEDAYEAVGLNVTLNEMSPAAYSSELYSGSFPAFFMREFPILPDAGYALALNYPCGSFLNASNYCNSAVDERLAAAAETLDRMQRSQLFHEIQELMVVSDANSVWLAEPGWQLITAPNVTGVAWDTPNLFDVTLIDIRR